MRGKRAKQYRKLMKQYALMFGFREPYQVLVDSQMIEDANRFAMDLPTSLSRTLSGNVKPMITQCSIRHLYKLPTSHPQKQALISAAKAMERRRCNHHELEEPLSTLECLSSVIDPKSTHTDVDLVNKFNYVVAVQDEEVRRWCRGVRGVPLLYVKRSVMVMEPMAGSSARLRDGTERAKFKSGLRQNAGSIPGQRRNVNEPTAVVHEANLGGIAAPEEEVKKRKRKRGPKEPNPLSVKKAKRKAGTVEEDGVDLKETVAKAPPAVRETTVNPRKRRRKHKTRAESGETAIAVGEED